jgi:hypothetical protein
MRILEIQDATSNDLNSDDVNNQTDASLESDAKYASKAELAQLSKQLNGVIPDGRFDATGKVKGKPVEHIRIFNASRSELMSALNKMGFVEEDLRPEQAQLSTKYAANIFSFSKNNKIFSFVISTKGTGDVVGVGIKEYSPTNLGLAGKVFTRNNLITAAKDAVSKKAKNEDLKNALLGLIDIASNRGEGILPPELNQAIKTDRKQLSVDFGEVLAPIAIMDDNDQAEFPVGNSPLIDVKIGSMNVSVKSLSGSGTSFRSIADLMDKYEEAITTNDPNKEKYEILKQFHPKVGGNNKDKIIAASAKANIAEHISMMKILNIQKLTSFKDLTSALANDKKAMLNYTNFLKKFYPAMTAGDWGKPVGLPADGMYYMGLKKDPPKKEKAAGKRSFDSNPVDAGANILTYVLGVGLLNFITRGGEAEDYSKIMTDIVNKADAVIGKIDITVNGGISVSTKSFSDLQFSFQYHAPSHIPGNNLPGFIAILD